MKKTCLRSVITLLLISLLLPHAHADLIVHEWGTITTHHLPDGTQRGRLNRIDESELLPSFVHKFEPPQTVPDPQPLTKSPLIAGRPDVTMRLETPVIYFYSSDSSNQPNAFDVDVQFRGGVLNEFYPNAQPAVTLDMERITSKMQAGVIPTRWDGNVLNNFVRGALTWKALRLQDETRVPDTTMSVWLAPRKVGAKSVLTQSGEGEKYLFYRGVANLEALLRTKLSKSAVTVSPPIKLHWLNKPSMTVSKIWLVEIKDDSTLAFREFANFPLPKAQDESVLQQLPLFSDSDFSAERLNLLRGSMKKELKSAGLYDDEAEAMLETWKESYFHTPGKRLFYTVPQEWLQYFLPLSISVPHEAKRVFIGRIDLHEGP